MQSIEENLNSCCNPNEEGQPGPKRNHHHLFPQKHHHINPQLSTHQYHHLNQHSIHQQPRQQSQQHQQIPSQSSGTPTTFRRIYFTSSVIMPPIIALSLPILLSKPLDNQLLTLYLIRSSPNKEPYDPDYVKTKRLTESIPVQKVKKPPKKKIKPKPLPKIKEETAKPSAKKLKKSKQSTESKNPSKSKSTQPFTSTPYSKTVKTSRPLSPTAPGKSTSQVLSVPSTSKAKSTQYGNTSKTIPTPIKRKRSDTNSSSSRTSASGTPSTSRSDSTNPRTPLKSNQLNYSSPSPTKPKKAKLQPKVPEAFRNFKIPKKPKVPPVDEKLSIPRRLQPSGNSPVDLIIGSSPGFSSTSAKINPSNQSRESIKLEEDFDSFETAEPELDFDLYGAEGSFSQILEDTSNVNVEPLTVKNEETKDRGSSESYQDDPMDQSLTEPSIPSQSILKQFDDDSESSDDEGNFKRRGLRDKFNRKIEITTNPTQSTRLRPAPVNKSQSTPKVISLRPSSSSTRPPIPASLSPPRHQHLSPPCQPPPPPPPQPSASSSTPTVHSVISSITSIECPEEAMKMFIKSADCYPQILSTAIPRFQNLFRNLLLNLFRDVNFILSKRKFEVTLKLIRQLNMDDSYNWEEIICSWGRNYKSLSSNKEKLENIDIVVSHIYDHLQSNKVLINLQAAGCLYEMKMAANENDN